MRLLAVVDGVAVTDLACREVVQRAAAGHRPRLGAQHRAHTDTTAAKPSTGHEHAPVEAARLAGAEAARSVAVARFVEALHDHRPVESNVPAAPRAVHAVIGVAGGIHAVPDVSRVGVNIAPSTTTCSWTSVGGAGFRFLR